MNKMYMLAFALVIIFPCVLQGQADSASIARLKYWHPDREYIYSAYYYDSTGEIITSEQLVLEPTGEKWSIDTQQTLVRFKINFTTEDSARLAPYPLNGMARGWLRSYREGAIEKPAYIWMHPVRSNQYLLTELAPFPEARFPLEDGKNWNNQLFIYKAFGTFEGTVTSNYTVSKPENRVYDFDTLNCWKITGIGIHERLGRNEAVYYFNEEYGFTEMNYIFYNKQKINFKLLSLRYKN